MDNLVFNRLKELLSDSGLNLDVGTINYAEIATYAYILQWLADKINTNQSLIFINNGCTDFDRYISLLNITVGDEGSDEIRSQIISRLGMEFGNYTAQNFDNEFNKIGSGTYKVGTKSITFYNVDYDDLYKLGAFCLAWVPAMLTTQLDGSGLTFDEWDELNYNFNKLDATKLNFDMIDTLRSDSK